MIIWIIGLAGAGKTVIGRRVYQRLKDVDNASVFLDGDHVREIMGNDLGHSIEDRRRNAWRICRLCHYLDGQGINVVCSILSLFAEHQDWNRKTFSNYFEVFVDVPLEILTARDQKGLYSGALTGRIKDVVGIDIPFTAPANADLIVRNDGDISKLDEIAAKIHDAATSKAARA